MFKCASKFIELKWLNKWCVVVLCSVLEFIAGSMGKPFAENIFVVAV